MFQFELSLAQLSPSLSFHLSLYYCKQMLKYSKYVTDRTFMWLKFLQSGNLSPLKHALLINFFLYKF